MINSARTIPFSMSERFNVLVGQYDPEDRDSVLEYASRLTGHTLMEFGEYDADPDHPVHTKGRFGQDLERFYFHIPNNNSPLPDFATAHIELKTTPLKHKGAGLVSKERLVLSIINYENITKGSWERMFMAKDSDLLIIFYTYERDVPYYLFKVTKVVHWTFPGEDLRMIREDWDVIEGYVLDGRAHELSEGLTNYLAACTKGAGHGKDLRTQPFSPVKARQRALSLKASYMTKVYRESTDLAAELRKGGPGTYRTDDAQVIFETPWDRSLTFSGAVEERMGRFIGSTCAEIERSTGEMSYSKAYYALLANHMLGVRKKHIAEFRDADIEMKVVRLTHNGRSKESMSFPYFDYREIAEQEWEDSDLFAVLEKRFFFVVYQMTDKDDKDHRGAVFRGTFFWTMGYEDKLAVQKVWERTKHNILEGDYDHFPMISEGTVAHVRPHGRDSKDLTPGPDGHMHLKRSFWLNASYITELCMKHIHRTNGDYP